MTTLKGTGGINVRAFDAQSRQLTAEYEAEVRLQRAAQQGARYEPKVAPGAPPVVHTEASVQQTELGKILAKEATRGGSPIDWSRFAKLLSASPAELKAAEARLRTIDKLDLDFQAVVKDLKFLGDGLEIDKLPLADAKAHYADRVEMLARIDAVRVGLAAAVDSPAAASFPTEQLALLEKALREDMTALVAVKGEKVKERGKPAPRLDGGFGPVGKSWGGGWGIEKDPSPDLLPATRAVTKQHVATVEGTAEALASRLGDPALGPAIVQTVAKAPEAQRGELVRMFGAYAILADEALHAPDYKKNPMGMGPDHRQVYRAREHGGGWGAKDRQGESKAQLVKALAPVLAGDAPVARMQETLAREVLREIGVSTWQARDWAPKSDAIVHALEGEGFLPLRALVERAPVHAVREAAVEMQQVVHMIAQSVVEGRFEEWRASNPASQQQLALLTPAQRKIWLEGVSTTHEVKAKDGKVLTFQTAQPRDMERFWATKVGGPSHGFDTMTQCLVPLLTNARNDTIVVADPRWPNFAGRTYLRLVQLTATKEPVLFLESSHKDFPYPGSKRETESAIVKHAIAKAKQLDLPLVLSGRNEDTIKHLALPGAWRNEQYHLAPSLLYEAASVFGPHDWVQKKPEDRGASSIQFFVDLAKA
ncbi:hypothetical protein L6R52_33830 [Myxococcota bacterium]|nr:hypothetical protein [Myxococcota bacterium]